jgi:RNA polymerase sigma-70 factor (ECF subfamily)
MEAARTGDTAALAGLLAEDVVLISDGGGKRPAALRPIVGRAEVVGLLEALRARGGLTATGEVRVARINGAPGLIVPAPDGPQTVTFEADAEGRITAIFIVRNPDKLARLPPSPSWGGTDGEAVRVGNRGAVPHPGH